MKSELYSRLNYEFRNVFLVYERFNIGNIPESYATFLNGSRTLEFGLSESLPKEVILSRGCSADCSCHCSKTKMLVSTICAHEPKLSYCIIILVLTIANKHA